MSDGDYLRSAEIVPLYALLRERQDDIDPALHGLLARIERRLFEVLSIEEIEAISSTNRAAVEALSKKL